MLPVEAETMAPEVLPIIEMAFPFMAGAAIGWVLYELYQLYMRGHVQGPRGYAGFAMTARCSNPRSGPIVRESYTALTGGFTPRHAAVNACTVLAGQNADDPPAINTVGIVEAVHTDSGPPFHTLQTQWIEEWCRPGGVPGSVVPVPSYPPQVGRTYPLGTPGADPYRLPSALPLLAPAVGPGTYQPLPWRAIPDFDRLAEVEWSPWIQREVGPSVAPSDAPWHVPDEGPEPAPLAPWWERPPLPSPAPGAPPWVQPQPVTPPWTAPWLPPQVDPSEPSPVPFPPIYTSPEGAGAPTGFGDPGLDPEPDVLVDPNLGRRLNYDPPVGFADPGSRSRERKLRATPKGLIHLLALTTYAGGLTRNLYMSIPAKLRKKCHCRRYSCMWRCIYKNFDAIDWDKFQNLAATTFAKYGIEGALISAANRGSTGSGFGIATNLYHVAPYPPDGFDPSTGQPAWGGPSKSGGAFSGRSDPFQFFTDFLNHYGYQGGG